MYRERSGPDPKPEKRPKAKRRRLRKNPTDKKEQVNQLIIDLDTVFSIFIRQRGMDSNGVNQCYTCGKFEHWKHLQCGHYLSRRYYGTRWSEENARPQCTGCNLFHEGNKPAFTLHLVKDFGLGYLDKLEILKNRMFKLEVFNLQLLINQFQSKIK